MACPQCLESDTIKKHVEITVECPVSWRNLSKSGIRKKEVQIMSAYWGNARFVCDNCGWWAKAKSLTDEAKAKSHGCSRDLNENS